LKLIHVSIARVFKMKHTWHKVQRVMRWYRKQTRKKFVTLIYSILFKKMLPTYILYWCVKMMFRHDCRDHNLPLKQITNFSEKVFNKLRSIQLEFSYLSSRITETD